MTQEQAEQNRESYKEKIKNAFSFICYSASVQFFYTESEPKEVCSFKIELFGHKSTNFGEHVRAYLLENNYKEINDTVFYNDDFIISVTSEYIEVIERSKFKNAMKSLMK